MIPEKDPWPDGRISPWAGNPDPPTVFEIALAYPGRALANACFALLFGGLVTAIVLAGIFWLVNTLVGAAIFTSLTPMVVLWPLVSAGFWWGGMYGEIRGWWVSDNSDAE